MNNDVRKEALAALVELSEMAPELRIGQLVAHLGEMSEDDGGHGLGDIEDDRLLEVIRRHHQRSFAGGKAIAEPIAGADGDRGGHFQVTLSHRPPLLSFFDYEAVGESTTDSTVFSQ